MINVSEQYEAIDGQTIETLETLESKNLETTTDAHIAKLESEYSDLRLMVLEANEKQIDSFSVANWRSRMVAIQNEMVNLLSV